MNVSFTTEDGELVEFDKHGDPPGRSVGIVHLPKDVLV